jgi:hypothetical protein
MRVILGMMPVSSSREIRSPQIPSSIPMFEVDWGFCFAPGSFRSSPGDRRGPLPQPIRRVQLRVVPGVAAAAVSWYRRARELGITEAEILLQGMPTR